jgi:hypothetical protein
MLGIDKNLGVGTAKDLPEAVNLPRIIHVDPDIEWNEQGTGQTVGGACAAYSKRGVNTGRNLPTIESSVRTGSQR